MHPASRAPTTAWASNAAPMPRPRHSGRTTMSSSQAALPPSAVLIV